MYLLRINSLCKRYKQSEEQEKVVLDNVSLMLPSSGLVAVVGKSGSGKSTLLNMISLLDKPSSGALYFNNENVSLWNQKRISEYRNKDIGIVFQHYQLLENETALYNITLPALIGGCDKKEAEERAFELLDEISFDQSLYNKKCKDLSGGEKERIAILRALINNPKLVLADEPTGALDSHNSEMVMETFKKIGKSRLVIFVTHNMELVKKYADSIITIKDGKVKATKEYKDDFKEITDIEKYSKLKKNKWATHLTFSNFKRRFKRNQFSIFGLIIGLVSSLLIIGFSSGSKTSIKNRSFHQLDYGVSTIYKETSQRIPGSKMALVQMSRLNEEEKNSLKEELSPFYIEPNTDALLPPASTIRSGESKLEDITFQPVYSFLNNCVDTSLLIDGTIPQHENIYEVVINKKAHDYLKKKFNSDPLGLELQIHSEYQNNYYTNENSKPVISDYFIFDKSVRIVGVVDDFNFLSTPKIFYSYLSFKYLLEDSLLVNLSSYLEMDISWYEYISFCDSSDPLSSYSNRLFLKDINNQYELDNYKESIIDPYKLESTPMVISETLLELISAATMGMELFLVIALAGTALIMGIISFSSYSEDKKTSAILTCLGANKGDIFSIYFYENLLIGTVSLITSIIVSPLLAALINKLVYKLTGFESILSIPFGEYLGIRFLLPIIIVTFTFLICVFGTYVPLFFSKKISPREELADE